MLKSFFCLTLVSLLLPIGCNKKKSSKVTPHTTSETPATPSSDAALQSLSVSTGALSPAFSTNVTSYSMDLSFRHSSLTVTAAGATGSTVTVNGEAAPETVDLAVGTNTITVEVTAEDTTTTRSYTLTVERQRQFVYVTNVDAGAGADSVSLYSIHPSTGVLEPLSTPSITVENDPYDLALDPIKQNLYINNSLSNTMSMLGIDPLTGIPAALTTPTIATGTEPYGIAFHPDGIFAYSANGGDGPTGVVSQWVRDPLTGILTANATPTVSTGEKPWFVAVDPEGRFAYVTSFGSWGHGTADSVYQYSIDQTSGDLVPLATASIATEDKPWYVAVDPAGQFVYVTNYGSDTVSMFSLQGDGELTSLGTIATEDAPVGIAIDPQGRFLYVGNSGSTTVSMYSINGNGTLSAIGGGTIASGANPYGMKIDSTGTYLYVANSGTNTVSMFQINQTTGALTALSTATVTAGTNPRFIEIAY